MGNLVVHEAGSGDLENQDDLVLHEDHLQLLLNGLGPGVDPCIRELLEGARNTRKQALPLGLLVGDSTEDVELPRLLEVLSKAAVSSCEGDAEKGSVKDATIQADNGELLPNKITFPYSRHSSHSELRGLVSVFRPWDIYPCVVDDAGWDESKAIEYLFGDLCEGKEFIHDREMRAKVDEEQRMQEAAEGERAVFEMESQTMLDRTQLNSLPGFDPHMLKERLERFQEEEAGEKEEPLAKVKAIGFSTAICSPISRPTTPRSLKRPVEGDAEDDDTPKARKLNPPLVRKRNGSVLSPPLPPMLARELNLSSSGLTPLEQARLAGSSTASSSQQSSPVKPRPTRSTWSLGTVREDPILRDVPRTPVRTKREEHSSLQQEFFDASNGIESMSQTVKTHQRRRLLDIVDNELDPSMDEGEVLEAMEAVLGVDGRSWWDVGLRCTEKKWRYVEEVEL